MNIPIYCTPDATPPTRNGSGWFDLYTTSLVEYRKGEVIKIDFGIILDLPPNYEAIISPRSSTLERYGIIMSGVGVIDNEYKGPNDKIGARFYALNSGYIPPHTAICQFRVQQNMLGSIKLNKAPIEHFKAPNRGGFGSTETKGKTAPLFSKFKPVEHLTPSEEETVYEQGFEDSYKRRAEEREKAYDQGYEDGHMDGYDDGYMDGYDDGFLRGINWTKEIKNE